MTRIKTKQRINTGISKGNVVVPILDKKTIQNLKDNYDDNYVNRMINIAKKTHDIDYTDLIASHCFKSKFLLADVELKGKYEKQFNCVLSVSKLKHFTLEETVTRYAKMLLFWMKYYCQYVDDGEPMKDERIPRFVYIRRTLDIMEETTKSKFKTIDGLWYLIIAELSQLLADNNLDDINIYETNNYNNNNSNTNLESYNNNSNNSESYNDKYILRFGDEICYVKPYTDNFLYDSGYSAEDKLKALILSSNKYDVSKIIINLWGEELIKRIYLHTLDNNVVSFILIHKTDYDPEQEHKNPFVIDYVYTYPEYRNQGHATILLNKMKNHFEYTAFCCTNYSKQLFKRCGFKSKNDYTFRYP